MAVARPVIVTLLACFSSAAFSAEFLRLDVAEDDGLYRLEAEMSIEASPGSVHAVITDFDGLHRLSESIRSSRRLPGTAEAGIEVATYMKVCLGPLCRYASQVQRVTLEGDDRIVAEAIPERSDFELHLSTWELAPRAGGTQLRYSMQLMPRFWVPPLIGPPLVKRAMRKQGEEMATNLERLAAGLDQQRTDDGG